MKDEELAKSIKDALHFFNQVKKNVPGYEVCFDDLIQTLEKSMRNLLIPDYTIEGTLYFTIGGFVIEKEDNEPEWFHDLLRDSSIKHGDKIHIDVYKITKSTSDKPQKKSEGGGKMNLNGDEHG